MRRDVLLIISLRYGTYSTADAVNAGMDLEMPGPTRWRGQLITHSLTSKRISPHTLDLRVLEVLNLVNRVTKTGVPENAPEGSRDVPETAELLRKISGESIVLMKNKNGVLPFTKSKTVRERALTSQPADGQLSDSEYVGRGNWPKCKGCSLLWWRIRLPAPILHSHSLQWHIFKDR